MKKFNSSDNIFFLRYFIIREDRKKLSRKELSNTCTNKILRLKDGDLNDLEEVVSWVTDFIKKNPIVIVPFPSTRKFKPKKKQLPFLIMKELCDANPLWIDGSNFLFRKYSLPKNTRNYKLQFNSLECDGKKIKGKDVIIIDDVITTGSSLKAGINIIKKGKPKSIKALAVAKKVYLKEIPDSQIF